jgi:glutathionylspermidine synthase
MFPNNEYLLESHTQSSSSTGFINKIKIAKPLLGREGQQVIEFVNKYPIMDQPYVIQEKFNAVRFGYIEPVIGSWVIGDESAGIGIREDYGITTNNSSFVPHIFTES